MTGYESGRVDIILIPSNAQSISYSGYWNEDIDLEFGLGKSNFNLSQTIFNLSRTKNRLAQIENEVSARALDGLLRLFPGRG